MSKPSIGAAVTPALEKEKKCEIKELTVLEDSSKESIYYLVFSEAESETLKKNDQ